MATATKCNTIIHDGENNFLGFNCRSWVPGADGDIFQATYPNALRVARNLVREAGRRVFISFKYGDMDQEDRELLEDGKLLPSIHPNRYVRASDEA